MLLLLLAFFAAAFGSRFSSAAPFVSFRAAASSARFSVFSNFVLVSFFQLSSSFEEAQTRGLDHASAIINRLFVCLRSMARNTFDQMFSPCNFLVDVVRILQSSFQQGLIDFVDSFIRQICLFVTAFLCLVFVCALLF